MYKLVILEFGEGSFDRGFPVTLQIREEGNPSAGMRGRLPPAPDLLDFYTDWQETYRSLEMQPRMALLNFWCKWYWVQNEQIIAAEKLYLWLIVVAYYLKFRRSSRIVFPEGQVTNVSLKEDCQSASESLIDRLNQWLYTDPFRPLRESVIEHVKRTDVVQILLQTQDLRLQRLPWHLCDLFERYPRAEVALSAPRYHPPTVPRPKSKVKILAILGNSEGIDLKKDRAVLEQLPNAVPLVTS